jgi:hypothetical protein
MAPSSHGILRLVLRCTQWAFAQVHGQARQAHAPGLHGQVGQTPAPLPHAHFGRWGRLRFCRRLIHVVRDAELKPCDVAWVPEIKGRFAPYRLDDLPDICLQQSSAGAAVSPIRVLARPGRRRAHCNCGLGGFAAENTWASPAGEKTSLPCLLNCFAVPEKWPAPEKSILARSGLARHKGRH